MIFFMHVFCADDVKLQNAYWEIARYHDKIFD